VDADKKEIYVRTAGDKLLELYFTDNTTLTKGEVPVEFMELKKKARVEVTAEQKGNKLSKLG